MPNDGCMGTLLYGSPPSEIEMDDRLLAHLKVVIISKLRRNEPFLLSWERTAEQGSGRTSVWMHPSIPLQFSFAGGRRPALNMTWVEQMSQAAMGNDGLRIMPEPPEH